jgi:5-methylcytosine-specific restriction endonuclease McrA
MADKEFTRKETWEYNQRKYRRERLFKILSKGNRKVVCHYCDTELTLDTCTLEHLQPKSKGGHDGINNCALVCLRCNYERGNLYIPYESVLRHRANLYPVLTVSLFELAKKA